MSAASFATGVLQIRRTSPLGRRPPASAQADRRRSTTRSYGSLLRECGGWPTPLSLPNPSSFEGTPLRTLARLELRVEPAIASRPPFDALGPSVTQDDFPAIVAAIREQNRSEFGPRADRPD